MKHDELWVAVLDRARQTYPAYIVTIWLELPITPVEIDGDGALVCKVDARHLGWIRQRYGAWLGKVVRELGAGGLFLEREQVAA